MSPENLTPAEVDRVEHLWDMGEDTSGHTMDLIRTVRALRAELGTIEGLLDYFGGLADLADKIRVEQSPAVPAPRPLATGGIRCKCMDADHHPHQLALRS